MLGSGNGSIVFASIPSWCDYLIEAVNCTFSGTYTYAPIYAPGPKDAVRYSIFNNIVNTNTSCVVNVSGATANGGSGAMVDNKYSCANIYSSGITLNVTTDAGGSNQTTTFLKIEDDDFNSSSPQGNPTGNGDYYTGCYVASPPGVSRVSGRAFSSFVPAQITTTNLSSDIIASLHNRSVARPLRIGDGTPYASFNINGNSESSKLFDSTIFTAFRDNNTNSDKGYHYPLVHAAMENDTIQVTGNLNLVPGTVIASLGSGSVFTFQHSTDYTLTAKGTPDGYIRFIDYAAAGDAAIGPNMFEAKSDSCASKYFDVDVSQMPPEGIVFQYCIFENAQLGIRLHGPEGTDYYGTLPRSQILDSIFRNNGISLANTPNGASPSFHGGVQVDHCDADIMNCLFDRNRAGIIVWNKDNSHDITTQFQPNIIGCTFSGGQQGILIFPGYGTDSTTAHTYATIEDCIFANHYLPSPGGSYINPAGIYVYGASGSVDYTTDHFTGIIRRNMFWNNASHVGDDDPNGDIDLTTCQVYDATNGMITNFPNTNSDTDVAAAPLFVNGSSIDPYAYQWRYDEDSSGKFFLAQKEKVMDGQNTARYADASREPLITGGIIGIARGATLSSSIQIKIFGNTVSVGGTNYSIPSPDSPYLYSSYQKASLVGSTFATGSNTNISYTQLIVSNYTGSKIDTPANALLTITFTSHSGTSGPQSSITCRLPALSLLTGQAAQFCVAQDGSLYWAMAAKAPAPPVAPTPANVDVFSAMHSSSDMLAQNWYTGTTTDKSPAIDKGTPDFLSGGGTSTEFVRAANTAYADHILPREYKQGYLYTAALGYTGGNTEYSSEGTELAKKLDLGFHYGGQQQSQAPSNESGSSGYVTLSLPIKIFPAPPAIATPESDSVIMATYAVEPNLVSYSLGTPDTWDTGVSVFAVKNTRLHMIPEWPDDFNPVVGQLFVRDYNGSSWSQLLGLSDLLLEYRQTDPPKTGTKVRYGIIDSFDSIAIPIDRSESRRGCQYAAALVHTENCWATSVYPTMNSIYLFKRQTTSPYAWERKSISNADIRPWNSKEVDVPGNPITKTMHHVSSVAMAHDSLDRIHIFWTEWRGGPEDDQNYTWDDSHYIRHTIVASDSSYVTDQIGYLENGRYYLGAETSSDAQLKTEQINRRLESGLPYHAAYRVISATYDDDTRVQGIIRLAFSQTDGTYSNVRTGRYDETANCLLQRTDLVQSSSDDLNRHKYNSICSGDFNGNNTPAWLKSQSLSIGNWVASEVNQQYRTADSFRCTLVYNTQTSAWNDSWSNATSLADNYFTCSDVRPSVATRGLRLPRYVIRGRVDQNRESIYSDGLRLLIRGNAPLIKTNTGNFIDQYLAFRPEADDETFTQLDKDHLVCITPLHP